jgi:hypothetical protein
MNRNLLALPLAIGLCACPPGEDTSETGDTDVVDTNVEPAVFEDFINTDKTPEGDLTCVPTDGTWLTQDVDATLQVSGSHTLTVLDFESDAPLAEANVDIWYADDATGIPDTSGVSDDNGEVSLDVPVCTPISYKTWTDPELEITRDTYEAHQIFAPDSAFDGELNSVSDVTYKIIPGLLGIPIEDGAGIIAGTVFGCDDEPIEHAEVVIKNADGTIPPTLRVKFFVNDPNRDQADTSPDGLWVAVNIPPGVVTAEAYTWNGTEHVLQGMTVVRSYPDSINIGNIYAGFDGGVKYPAECLVTE